MNATALKISVDEFAKRYGPPITLDEATLPMEV
jgi:hypothetical protein